MKRKQPWNCWRGQFTHQVEIDHDGSSFDVKKTFIEELQNNQVIDENFAFNGDESKTEYYGLTGISTVGLSATKDTLTIDSKVTFNRSGQTSTLLTTET